MLRFILPMISCATLTTAFSCTGSARDNRAASSCRDTTTALDTILLAESAREVGPVVFSHRRHHGPDDQGGHAIACSTCHHDFEDRAGPPPGSCRTCHPSHESGEEAVAGYL